MARIPTVAAPGQAVGTVRTGFTPQPFQRLDAPIEVFGGGDANPAASLSKSAAAFGADIDAMNKADDKVSSLKMQAEIDARTAEYQKQIKSVEGQERLNMLSGTHSSQMGGGYSLEQQYQQDLKNIRSNYQFATATGGEVADIAIAASQTNFTKDAFVQGLEARKLVQKQTSAAIVGAATVSAVQGVTDAGVNEEVLKTALGKVATSVTDPDVGMAKQAGITDSKQVALLVKEQQALVISKVFDELISRGNFAKAAELVDTHTKDKGILAGTPTAATLQAKVLPFQEEIRGQADFSKVLAGLSPNYKTADLLKAVQAAGKQDVNKIARLTTQLTRHLKVRAAELTSVTDAELQAAFAKEAAGIPITMRDIPNLITQNPKVAQAFLLQSIDRVASVRQNRQEMEHVQNGGGLQNDPVDRYMTRLAKTRPEDYIQLINSSATGPNGQARGVGRFVSREQLTAFQDKATVLEQKLGDIKSNFSLPTALKRMGFPGSEVENVMRDHSVAIAEEVVRVRKEVFGRTGKVADNLVIEQAVANLLIARKMAETGTLGEYKYDYQVAIAAGLVKDTIPLQDSKVNRRVIATALGAAPAEVDAVMKDKAAFWTKEGPTLKAVADAINKNRATVPSPKPPGYKQQPPLTDLRNLKAAADALDDMDDMATNSGYPYEFIESRLAAANKPLTKASFSQEIMILTARGAAQVKSDFEKWLKGTP